MAKIAKKIRDGEFNISKFPQEKLVSCVKALIDAGFEEEAELIYQDWSAYHRIVEAGHDYE